MFINATTSVGKVFLEGRGSYCVSPQTDVDILNVWFKRLGCYSCLLLRKCLICPNVYKSSSENLTKHKHS